MVGGHDTAGASRRPNARRVQRRGCVIGALALAAVAVATAAVLGPRGRCWAAAPAARGASQGSGRGDVALRAAPEGAVTKAPAPAPSLAKPIKYKAAPKKSVELARTNPKLINLMEAKEYIDVLQVAMDLQEQNMLDEFIKRLLDWYSGIEINDLYDKERKERENLKYFRREWSRVWPTKLDSTRAEAFEKVSNFIVMLDRANLVNLMLESVLPTLRGGTENDITRDQVKLRSMVDEEHLEEIGRRVMAAPIVQQYVKRCEDQEEKWYPLMQKLNTQKVQDCIISLTAQTARKGERDIVPLPETTSFAFYGFLLGAILAFVVSIFKVPLPFQDTPPLPPSSPSAYQVQQKGLDQKEMQELAETTKKAREGAPMGGMLGVQDSFTQMRATELGY